MDPGRMPIAAELQARWAAWVRAGVLASEMECAALLTVAAVRRVRAGAALAVVNAAPTVDAMPDPARLPIDALIEVTVDAVRRLARVPRP
jgi:uridine phosphorylase